MKKKIKKKNPQQIKTEKAHQKNIYMQKIKAMLHLMGCGAAFDLLDAVETQMIYLCRFRPVKLINPVNEEYELNCRDLKDLNEKANLLIKNYYVKVGASKQVINLYDFFAYLETLHLYWKSIPPKTPRLVKLLDQLAPMFNDGYDEVRTEAFSKLKTTLIVFSWICCDILHWLVWFEKKKEEKTTPVDLASFYNNYIVHLVKPETESLNVDGIKRTIYRVGAPENHGIAWMTIQPEELGVEGLLQKFPLKIYIQAHAVERMKERLDVEYLFHSFTEIAGALLQKKICRADDGGFLLAVTMDYKKLGYLKADIRGDKLIIRTFLFLTNNGTPEGKKLATLLGVKKEDKKYLGIDKLSTFLDSDIEQDENLKKIFCEAGCGDLFEIKRPSTDEQDKKMRSAAFISHYLCLDREQEGREIDPELAGCFDMDLQLEAADQTGT